MAEFKCMKCEDTGKVTESGLSAREVTRLSKLGRNRKSWAEHVKFSACACDGKETDEPVPVRDVRGHRIGGRRRKRSVH